MSARERLVDILSFTSSDYIDSVWPDNQVTLDEIAGRILDDHARELAGKQRERARQQYSCVIASKGTEWAGAWITGIDRSADWITPKDEEA